MIVLVSGATNDVRRSDPSKVGVLVCPRNFMRGLLRGRVWAADNAAFSGFDEVAFVRMLTSLHGVPGCKFVACPDVVGNAHRTRELFETWEPLIRAKGFPVALVAQDGLTPNAVPWASIDALFIGGTTAFKLSHTADALLDEAASWGKWRHVGRVNSKRRIRHFVGRCDSFDGSGFSKFGKRVAFAERWISDVLSQPQLLT